jgi:serine/threonine protein kinase
VSQVFEINPAPYRGAQLEGRLELSASELEWEAMFADLLDKMLTLDPEKRITVSEALKHKFVTTKFV